MTVISLARTLARDGRFSLDDARRVIEEATRSGAVAEVETLLADPAFAGVQVDAGARRSISDFLSAAASGSGSLGQLPDGSKVFLREGVFLPSPDAALPTSPREYGGLLHRAALLFAEPGLEDPVNKLGLEAKQAVLERILVGLSQVPAGGVPPGYDSEVQAAQQRSASATVLRSLVESLAGADGQGRLLQDRALTALTTLIEQESDPGLRDHMAFHLHAIKGAAATPEQRAAIEKAYEVFAPTSPPYDEWFADGNRQLNVVCHTGGEFYKSEVASWQREGFTVVSEGSGHGEPTVLERKYDTPDGDEMTVRLSMYSGSRDTFANMDDPDTHVVAYSGHSGWGKNMPAALAGSPDAAHPTKLVLIHQCCGQGFINKFRDKYDDAQLVTTRYSSYEREDHFAFKTALEGIAKRSGWTDIHDTIAAGRSYNRKNNYLTPADELTRMKTKDRDGDGKADLLDRLYDYDTFDVPGDTETAFVAKEPSRRDAVLSGERVHNASQIVNTSLGFSHYLDHMEKENAFVGGGHFEAPPGHPDHDRLVRIVARDVDPGEMNLDTERANLWPGVMALQQVELNRRFSHASEEVVKAVTFFEVAMTFGDGETPAERALQGLILAAHSLNVDDQYGRDELVFDNLRKHYGLPESLTFADARRYLNADSHVYAGADVGVERWAAALGPDGMKELSDALEG